jgi:hypothetical protein
MIEEHQGSGLECGEPPHEVVERAIQACIANKDLRDMDCNDLLREVIRLRDGIRDHRDCRGDDRCWFDDQKLYLLLPEKLRGQTGLNDKELMYGNCRRFIDTRVHPDDRFAWGDVPGGSMIPILEQVEKELPALLLHEPDWHTLLVDDEQPSVERVWLQYGQGRIYLHVIHPCAAGEPLCHPHPWPSIVRILAGYYETAYGHGPADGPPPPMAQKKVLGAGDWYEMVNPEAWHYVRPLGGPAVSLMVTGKPWKSGGHRKGRDLRPLDGDRRREIIDIFRSHYPRKPF